MTIEETQQKIIASDSFVLEELAKLQELFKMKRVIRYHHQRNEVVDTESVAEHVYGMLVLIDYFLPLEKGPDHWDHVRIQQMAIYHDIDEILTGDIIGYLKNDHIRQREFTAQQEVVKLLPVSIQERVAARIEEYENHISPEARFVKAIDKIEPLFHLINDNGKEICRRNKVTHQQSRSIKDKYVEGFPYISRFNEVLNQHMLDNGYFVAEK